MKQFIHFYALPGFLGEATDFVLLQQQLQVLHPIKWSFLESFELLSPDEKDKNEFSVGIGYSFGGRRLLEIMHKNPNYFDAGIFISTHPGLTDENEKQQRWLSDLEWANQLANLSTEDFFTQWNAQPALINSPAVFKDLTLEQKNRWVHLLKTYSLAHQPDYLSPGFKILKPQLWLAGAQDQKFRDLLLKVQQRPFADVTAKVIWNAGHRLLQMETAQVVQQIDLFLKKLIDPDTINNRFNFE